MHLFKNRSKKAKDLSPANSEASVPASPTAVEVVPNSTPVAVDAAPATMPDVIDMFDRFDSMFDEWVRLLPFPADRAERAWVPAELIRVDQVRQDGALVVRAELPGIDPDKDVELTVSDGVLRIDAERRQEERTEKDGYLRHELRYGTFRRSLPLPGGVTAADVVATYKDGILEVRIPVPAPTPVSRVPVAKA